MQLFIEVLFNTIGLLNEELLRFQDKQNRTFRKRDHFIFGKESHMDVSVKVYISVYEEITQFCCSKNDKDDEKKRFKSSKTF